MAKNSMNESDDDWEELVSYSSYITTISKVVINECLENNEHDDCNIIPNDHRSRQRSKRTCFDHDRAKECIYRDYLGSDALFIGKNFEMMFRLSRSRFQRLMEDISRSSLPFFSGRIKENQGRSPVSLEARLLLPLKCLAYGVPPHAFSDYFQMSRVMARECTIQFDIAMKEIYVKEYLRHQRFRYEGNCKVAFDCTWC